MRRGWVPPFSPYGLIQEALWPSEWLVLVSCVMLNCTRRKQVEGVLPGFIERWPTAADLASADRTFVEEAIRPLGLASRRAGNLIALAGAYVSGSWKHARELPGIGEYASRAWEIFCLGELGDELPKDHALVQYFNWAKMMERTP